MFSTEPELQRLIHERPDLVLSGIPDINPEYCSDTPTMISLGREISLGSGPVDNIFIDTNAVITFIECKRYSDARVKREVYPQAINYASDLQSQLIHFNGDVFVEELFAIINTGQDADFRDIDHVIDALSKDPIIEHKSRSAWRGEFLKRLEHNVKSGICRVIILCAPAPNNIFAYRAVRNLMQLMSFSEHSGAKYDLILMDLRQTNEDEFVSRIIWRRYSQLPQIPLIARHSRDTTARIEAVKATEERLPSEQKKAINDLLEALSSLGIIATENTDGYALKWKDNKRSLYVKLSIKPGSWSIIRHQIRPPEPLFFSIKSGDDIAALSEIEFTLNKKRSSKGEGFLYEIEFEPNFQLQNSIVAKAIEKIALR